MPWKTNIRHSVEEIAQTLGLTVESVICSSDEKARTISGIAALGSATAADLSFCKKAPLEAPTCGALMCTRQTAKLLVERKEKLFKGQLPPLLVVDDPVRGLLAVLPLFFENDPPLLVGVHSTAVIDPSATISTTTAIGAFSVIGRNCEIGDNTQIHPHVVLYPRVKIGRNVVIHANVVLREDTEIGNNVVIQPGSVIGADGFGYIPDAKLGLVAVPQVGAVTLKDYVEVGANSCIDRATLGTTRIGIGTKVDNLVQIGHNVDIGMHSIICGQVGIAGSSKIGNQVILGGSAGVADHLTIVDKVRVGARGTVLGDITEPGDYGGFPAVPARQWRRMVAALALLPDRLRKLGQKTNDEE